MQKEPIFVLLIVFWTCWGQEHYCNKIVEVCCFIGSADSLQVAQNLKRPQERQRPHSKEESPQSSLDKVAWSINTSTPSPSGGNGILAYLQDIDFYLQTHDHVTVQDRFYLFRGTSNWEICCFLGREPDMVKVDPKLTG